jgi:hypothetical protein
MSWLSSHGPEILTWALVIVGSASVLVRGIAPLTKTKLDDKLGSALSTLHGLLGKVALNPDAKK